MNESGRKKREWVKTAAIVFLSVMLVLTFFSSTIQNWSLPEVATQYVQSGTITAKTTITGTVESVDPYEVKVTESRKVASVAVRTGSTVEKGDVLIYLEGKDSTELENAKKNLEKAREEYNKALLSGNYTAADISDANKGVTAEEYMNQITKAQNSVKAAENAVKAAETAVENAEAAVESETAPYKASVEKITQRKKDHEEQVAYEMSMKSYLESQIKPGESNTELQELIKERETTIINLNGTLNNLGIELYAAQRNLSEVESAAKANVEINKKELAARQKELKEKQEKLTDLVTKANNVTSLEKYLDAISEAEEQVDELTENAEGTTITAPVSGTISAINVTAGNETSAAVPVVVMQREGQGFTLKYSAANDVAKRLSVGDVGSLVNAWRYDDVTVTLASIQPDPDTRGQNKLLTFNVTGSVVAGQSLSFTIGQKSANYNFIVPNSAVREDNNGKFILIVVSKGSPLGTRYTASRVDVQVIASDETQSAVSGALSGYEFVITTSTKPVEAGNLVRLPD